MPAAVPLNRHFSPLIGHFIRLLGMPNSAVRRLADWLVQMIEIAMIAITRAAGKFAVRPGDAEKQRKGLRSGPWRCKPVAGYVRRETPMTASPFGPYRVEAFNTARDSENKIHDDAIARRFGFGGGLVPGVDVYGYMAHLPVARWGRAWLERGSAECRFLKPVYDGETATVTAREAADGLDLEVESRGFLCATGRAALPSSAPPPALGAEPPTPPATRPPADERSLAPGTLLGITPLRLTADYLHGYLRDLRESDPLYEKEGLAHPAIILRTANWALSHNVALGPWMHVGSTIRHFAVAHVGDELSVQARVTANYERKGHHFVDAEVLVLANRTTPLAQIAHVSIWRPRQVAE
jgi:acyl dehydratase